jgi:hypothetical protein
VGTSQESAQPMAQQAPRISARLKVWLAKKKKQNGALSH